MCLRKMMVLSLCAVLLAALALPVLASDKAADAKEIVQNARATLGNFLSDPDMKWIRAHVKEAKAILIIPSQGKGGFIIAGSGGAGVLLTRNAKGQWSQPAFYRMGSVSIGLQAGGSASEVLLFVTTQKGVDTFLSSSFKLGAEASVAAGPVGEGAKAATSDVLSFCRSKGAFVGASFEGSSIKPSEDLNEAFYGKEASPVDILVHGSVKNKLADGLRKDLAKASAP